MRLRFYTLGGATLALGSTVGDATAKDLFDAMRRGELFLEPAPADDAAAPGDRQAQPAGSKKPPHPVGK